MTDAAPARRGDYYHFLAIPTRWIDNDVYGHINNVVYYAYFDTVVNEHLIRAGGLDIRHGPAIGLVVETFCRFHRPLSFPAIVDAGSSNGTTVRTEVLAGVDGIFLEENRVNIGPARQ